MEQRVVLIDVRTVARHEKIAPIQIGENLFAPLVFGQRMTECALICGSSALFSSTSRTSGSAFCSSSLAK